MLSQHEFQHLGEATNSSLPPYEGYADAGHGSALRHTQDRDLCNPSSSLQYQPLGYAEEPFKVEAAPKVVVSSKKT